MSDSDPHAAPDSGRDAGEAPAGAAPVAERRVRRGRHGRPLRATDGAFPGAAVPRERLAAEIDAATERLTARVPTLPAFAVDLRELPPADVVAQASPADVAAGALLGTFEPAPEGGLTVVLYARPLLLWADDPAALRTLVRQTLVSQVAEATGHDPDDLDPDDWSGGR